MLRPLLRRLLLPIALLAAVAASAQTVVMFSIAGTVNATGHGYTASDPLSVTFTMSVASDPVGGFNNPYIYWIRNSSTNPSASLFSSVTATGLSGTWNGTDSTSGVTDDEIVISTAFPANIDFLSSASNGNLRLSTPDSTPVTFINIQGQWTGLDLSNSGIADPVAYFAARSGTYSLVPGSAFGSAYLDLTVGSVAFTPTTLTISAMTIPEPETDAAFAGLGVLLFAFVRRHRNAA